MKKDAIALPNRRGAIDYPFGSRTPDREIVSMGIQHARKELRTAAKRRRKSRKNKLRSTKKYKK
ncbi:MAG TPA: hypothetical protein VGJ05_01830 [Fimbriiglobus sp.]|jgi:hypothetical protein